MLFSFQSFKNISQNCMHVFSCYSLTSPMVANVYPEKNSSFCYIYQHFKFCSPCQENGKCRQFTISHTLVLADSLPFKSDPCQ